MRIIVISLFAVILISACSLNLKIIVANNTGSSFTVKTKDKKTIIDNSTSRTIDFSDPDLALLLEANKCIYEYTLEAIDNTYFENKEYSDIAAVQVEKNWKMFLLPLNSETIHDVDSNQIAELQIDIFPVKPEVTCK